MLSKAGNKLKSWFGGKRSQYYGYSYRVIDVYEIIEDDNFAIGNANKKTDNDGFKFLYSIEEK